MAARAPVLVVERRPVLDVAARGPRRRARQRLHVRGGLPDAAFGERAAERRHVGARNPRRDDVDDRCERRRVPKASVQVRSGAAVAFGAVAPRALRVEALPSGGGDARARRRRRGARSRASSAPALRPVFWTATSHVGSDTPGALPPPTADDPSTRSARQPAIAPIAAAAALARARISSAVAVSMR